MEIKEVKKILCETVCEIQDLSGRSIPSNFCESTVPIGELEGFDSLNAVEVAVQLSEKFNCSIDSNPFILGGNPLTIEQIAQKILKTISGKEKK